MNNKPFVIDAVVGNARLLASLTRDGQIHRLVWPHVDGPQHVQQLLGGVSVDGGPVIWQDAWTSASQAYEPDQNVLVTRLTGPAGLAVSMTDAAVPGQDLLVRALRFANEGAAPVALRYVQYQWLRVDENPLHNTTLYDVPSDALAHYRRDTFIALGADRAMENVAVGSPPALFQGIVGLTFGGAGVKQGDVAAAAVWDLGTLAPGESVTLTLFWAMGREIRQVRELLASARAAGAAALLQTVRSYWTDWLARARPLVGASPAVDALYRRSLLVFKLMSDEATGSVIAAPEFDAAYEQCGGYGFCWGRDAAYITVAMDLAGYHDLAAGFYRWAVGAQEPEGWWAHRHYASGGWAPSWGLLQVDETGSILYGMAVHARLHGGQAFVRSVWDSVYRAADWLIGNLDPETGLPMPSDDLWEEREAEHTYSAGAVYAGLVAAAEMAVSIGAADTAARYTAAAADLRAAILRECVVDGRFLRARFVRVEAGVRGVDAALGMSRPGAGVLAAPGAEGRPTGRVRTGPKGHPIYEIGEDDVLDASLYGLATPFGVVAATDPRMMQTADRLATALGTAPIGGMQRYSGDPYRGGNPWVLCTLWQGLYEAERGDLAAARALLDWAVARQTETGLLPEQVDPVTGAPAWVVPLTWSHAMFVLLALKLHG